MEFLTIIILSIIITNIKHFSFSVIEHYLIFENLIKNC